MNSIKSKILQSVRYMDIGGFFKYNYTCLYT